MYFWDICSVICFSHFVTKTKVCSYVDKKTGKKRAKLWIKKEAYSDCTAVINGFELMNILRAWESSTMRTLV